MCKNPGQQVPSWAVSAEDNQVLTWCVQLLISYLDDLFLLAVCVFEDLFILLYINTL